MFGFVKPLLFVLFAFCAAPAFADEPGSGTSGGTPAGQNSNSNQQQGNSEFVSRREYEELMAKLKEIQSKVSGGDGGGKGDDVDPLVKKVEEERKKKESEQATTRQLEEAIAYKYSLDEFVKKNEDILPSQVAELVKAAKSETYNNAVSEAAAIKKAILDSFFSIQSNVDLLTESQKRQLDDYKKLTKEAKESQAPVLYTNLFEPSLQMLRRLKTAEELNRSREGIPTSNAEAAYKRKLIEAAERKYIRKQGA